MPFWYTVQIQYDPCLQVVSLENISHISELQEEVSHFSIHIIFALW